MKKIGILSDTHSYWDDRYLHYFESCDEIWHAGDICSVELAERLSEFRPLRAVCGNCDGGDLRIMYPEVLRWRCEDVDVLMKHIGGYPGNYDPSIRSRIYSSPRTPCLCSTPKSAVCSKTATTAAHRRKWWLTTTPHRSNFDYSCSKFGTNGIFFVTLWRITL